jgi:alpha-2-macroglobulin
VNMNFTKSKIKPKGFQHYTFEDPSRYWSDESMLVHQGETNAQGLLDFALNIPDYMKGPGKLNAQFVARAMEKGGDFTTAIHSMVFNPYDRYVGLLPPEPAGSGYLHTDTSQVFEVAMLSANEKRIQSASLKVEVYKQDWSWWWSGEGSSGNYVSVQHNRMVHTETLSIRNGKASFKWKLEYPEWGAYFVRVVDEEGGHSAGRIVYFDWPGWYSRDGRAAGGGASTISISLDKETYNSGETAIISFPSAENGQALISIEKGDRQLRSWWVPTNKDETSFSLDLEDLFAPNIYVHIMVLQPHGQTLNDLPIRMYGLVMLPVTNKEAKLQPFISMPDELRPETTFKLKVREQNGKAMSYTIAMVDEGLLDLTNFRTPDPYAYFYAREALGLKTWDMFDHVIGAYGGRIEQVFAIGGDEAITARERARQSRFKPVVHFLGPFSLEKNGENMHHIAMPNYVGSVRLMVAATSGNAFGQADKTSAVKQPVMVLGTLPRVLRPGDELMLPVTVFSGFKNKQEIAVQVDVSGNLMLEGEGSEQLIFDGEGEQMTYFRLKVPEKEGMASIRIDAFSGKEKAYYSQEIAVQNPNSRQYVTEKHILESGKRITLNNKMIGLPETRMNRLEFSGMPVVNLDKRLQYLNTFPYGCTEQITSIGFAQLYLAQFTSSEDAVNRKTAQHIKSAIEKIVLRLQQDGSLRYWPGGSYINEFAAVYAGHFMVLASREGHPVPSYFLNQWTRDQKRKAGAWQPELYANRLLNDVVQAYRLYALALAGEAQTAAMNRLRENPKLSTVAANMLGAAYAVVGQEDAARELIMGKKNFVSHNSHYQYTFGSELRDKAMRMEALIRIGENAAAFKLVAELAEQLGKDSWLSTQETAYALYSLQLFMRQFPPQQKELHLLVTEGNGDAVETKTTNNYGTITLTNDVNTYQVENKGTETLFVNYLSAGIPLRDDNTVVEDNLALNINWQDMGGQAINPENIKQGTAFEMVVRVRNASNKTQHYLVLDQIIPSGWEIVNKRLTGEGAQPTDVDYTDIRDDRVTTFFTLLQGQEKVFRISLLAAYEGKFYLPPTVCSAMYDHSIQARKGGGEVEVKRE